MSFSLFVVNAKASTEQGLGRPTALWLVLVSRDLGKLMIQCVDDQDSHLHNEPQTLSPEGQHLT
jgi:hypothetical protein